MEDIIEEVAKVLAGSAQSGQLPFSLEKDELQKLLSQVQKSPWVELFTTQLPKHVPVAKEGQKAECSNCPFSTYLFAPRESQNNPVNTTQVSQVPVVTSGSQYCPVDIREMESYIAVYFDLPGVKKTDISLQVSEENILNLRVEKCPYAVSSDTFLRRERFSGVITRNIKLPKNINTVPVSAKYEEGVLCVKFNKIVPSSDLGKKILIS